MAENAKIKQIQIDSTTYDIEPAAQAEGTAVAVVTSISGGSINKTTKYLHANKTNVAPNAHTHDVTVSGTTGNDSGNGTSVATAAHTHGVSLTANTATATGRIAYVESHTAASLGTPSTSNAAPNGHTHSYTPSGTVSLGSNTTASGGTKYIEAVGTFTAGTTPPKSAAPTNETADTAVNSGTAINAVTGYPDFSGGTLTGTKTFVTGVSGGSGSLEAYDAATSGTKKVSNGTRIPFLTAVASDGSVSGTNAGTAAPNEHTHSYTTYSLSGSNASGTLRYFHPSFTGIKTNALVTDVTVSSQGSIALTANTGTATGRIQYLTDIIGSAPSLTGTTTFVTDRGTFTKGSGSFTASRGTSGSGTAARRTLTLSHSHTASSLTAQSTDSVGIKDGSYTPDFRYLSASHSGTTLSVVKDDYTPTGNVSLGSNTTASGGVSYISTMTNGSLALEEGTGTTGANSGTGVSTIGGVSYTAPTFTTYYLAHSHTGASASGTGTVGFTAASLGTANTAEVAANGHTHTYSKTTGVTLTAGTAPSLAASTVKYFHPSFTGSSDSTEVNSGTAIAAVTGYPDFSGGSATVKYLSASTSATSGTTTVASHTHTHSFDAGTITSTQNSGTAVSVVTSLSAATAVATGDITYLENVTHTNAAVSSTVDVIKAE